MWESHQWFRKKLPAVWKKVASGLGKSRQWLRKKSPVAWKKSSQWLGKTNVRSTGKKNFSKKKKTWKGELAAEI